MEWHQINRSRILLIIAAFFAWLPLSAEAPAILQSLNSIHQLTNADALKHPTVDFEATVTYYRDYEHTLFVQDGASAIYVYSPTEYPFVPGDRLRIRGELKESFRPIIAASEIDLLHHGDRVFAIPVSYSDLADARLDGVLVTIRGIAKSADIAITSDRPDTRIDLRMDAGPVEAYVDSPDAGALAGLLDAQVEITGVASGRFGGKMEMTGIVIHVQRMADIKVLKNSSEDPGLSRRRRQTKSSLLIARRASQNAYWCKESSRTIIQVRRWSSRTAHAVFGSIHIAAKSCGSATAPRPPAFLIRMTVSCA